MTVQIAAPDFDLGKTLGSGQVFHWISDDQNGYYGLIGDLPVYVSQTAQSLVAGGDTPELPEIVRHYFALDHPLSDICQSFPNDPIMNAAADYCGGLRIIRQPKWECLATFICSSMKQVAHIRQISRSLRERFGESRRINRRILHTFPAAERLARSSEKELRECALGYRAKNLLATARLISSGQANLEEWSKLPDADVMARLCALPGVGPKVANCVMLFAFERLRAFPIDVWIERVLRQQYFRGKRKPTTAKLRAFSADYFGQHGGYAQQYLFHHARMTSRKLDRFTPSTRITTPNAQRPKPNAQL